ncbi:hypothetical protein PVK06_043745 [Gossypium arboreum]|uniref:RNase H type-1 domain-containing protein n=1 Tax=Gossypium arboreum TaxID=29729 RepID=A0ABR0MPS0_GOSAR|nr:hypothetical protein PVK06_043745 [Gossypium arboreum]
MGVFYRSLSEPLWSPVDLGVTKINFDATFQSDSRTSTSTVIARDYKEEYVGAETDLFNDVVDAFVAEARACERALLFAINMGFHYLLVEGDSLTVINKLKVKEEDRSIIRLVIHYIHHLEKCFEEICYLFVPRLVNGVAYTLAMEGRRRQRFGFWVDEVPNYVKMLGEKD